MPHPKYRVSKGNSVAGFDYRSPHRVPEAVCKSSCVAIGTHIVESQITDESLERAGLLSRENAGRANARRVTGDLGPSADQSGGPKHCGVRLALMATNPIPANSQNSAESNSGSHSSHTRVNSERSIGTISQSV